MAKKKPETLESQLDDLIKEKYALRDKEDLQCAFKDML